jgi:hypothetical protein
MKRLFLLGILSVATVLGSLQPAEASLPLQQVLDTLEQGGVKVANKMWQASEQHPYHTLFSSRPYWVYLCTLDQPLCPAKAFQEISTVRIESRSLDGEIQKTALVQQDFATFTRALLSSSSETDITTLVQRIDKAVSDISTLQETNIEFIREFPIDISGVESLGVTVKVIIARDELSNTLESMALHFELN